MTLKELLIKIGIDVSGLDRGVGEFENRLDRMSSKMQASGTALTIGLTAPIVAVGAAALTAGIDFEGAMNKIQGVLQPTGDQMARVRDTAMQMGAETVFSATDSAEAMLELGKAGFETEEAIASVDEVLQLAAASGLSMGDAAAMAARTMNAFGLETSDLAHVNDVLAGAVNKTSLEIGDLQVAFGYVGPIAQGLGMSLEQTSAALGLMRDAGIAAETSGRALREGLTRLLNPTKDVSEVVGSLGLEFFNAAGKLKPLDQIVQELEPHAKNTGAMMKLFGDAAGPAMAALATQGSGALVKLTTDLEKTDGSAKKLADAMMAGLPGAVEKMKGSVETASLALSTALEPAAVGAMGAIEGVANFITTTAVPAFESLPEPLQATALGLLAIAAAAGPLLLALGSMTSVWAVAVKGLGVANAALFTLGNTLPVVTARLWLMDAAGGKVLTTLRGFAAAAGWIGLAVTALGLLHGASIKYGMASKMTNDQLREEIELFKKSGNAQAQLKAQHLQTVLAERETAAAMRDTGAAAEIATYAATDFGNEMIAKVVPAVKAVDTATRTLKQEQDEWTATIGKANTDLTFMTGRLLSVIPAVQSMNVSVGNAHRALASSNEVVEKATLDLGLFENALYNLPPALESMAVSSEASFREVGESTTLGDGIKTNLIGALAEVPNIIEDAFSGESSVEDLGKKVGAVLGAAIGGAIGAYFGGPFGAQVGASAGSAIGQGIAEGFRTIGEDVVRRIGASWGVTISEEIGNKIAQDAMRFQSDTTASRMRPGDPRLTIPNRGAAETFNIGGLIGLEGGLNDDNIDMFTSKFRDLFTYFNDGAFSAVEAVQVLDENFQTFADNATKGGKLASKEFLELISLTEANGLRSEAVDQFISGQAASAVGGIMAMVGPAAAAYQGLEANEQKLADLRAQLATADAADKGKILSQIAEVTAAMETQGQIIAVTGVHSQEAAAGIGAALFGSFAGMVEHGMSAVEAIKAMAPAIDAFSVQLEATGYSGGAAFGMIQDMAALAADEVAGPALESIHGAATALGSLHNAGILNQEMFGGLTGQITTTFEALVAQGYDGAAAVALIAPDLQKIWELQKEFGYTVDEGTQALIDQAVASGAVGEQHQSVQQKTLDVLLAIADVFGAKLPDSMKKFGETATETGEVVAGAFEGEGADGVMVFAESWRDASTDVVSGGRIMADELEDLSYGTFGEQLPDDMRAWTVTYQDELDVQDSASTEHNDLLRRMSNETFTERLPADAAVGYAEIVDGSKDAAKDMLSAFASINVPEIVIKYRYVPSNSLPGGGSSSSSVPAFAEGGIVTGPMVGMVGEAGPEAIIPLDRLAGLDSGTGHDAEILYEIAALRADMRDFPRAIARASRDYTMTSVRR